MDLSSLTPLAGGWSGQTFLAEVAGERSVVRIYPPGQEGRAETDAAVEILDIGARSAAGPGGWVVGRLVPTGIGELTMFDMSPLPVAERVAVEMAAHSGESSWAPITAALAEGRMHPAAFLREDYELLTDVQELDLLAYGTPTEDLDRVMRQLRSGRDEVGRAAFRVLRHAAGNIDGRVSQARQGASQRQSGHGPFQRAAHGGQ